jgi:hypothetical protein
MLKVVPGEALRENSKYLFGSTIGFVDQEDARKFPALEDVTTFTFVKLLTTISEIGTPL